MEGHWRGQGVVEVVGRRRLERGSWVVIVIPVMICIRMWVRWIYSHSAWLVQSAQSGFEKGLESNQRSLMLIRRVFLGMRR